MAGHSKWHQIRHKKGANDKQRGKVFTKHSRLITLAAKNGDDPDLNASLRSAIDNAKAENVPNDNIKRAIAKASLDAKNQISMAEVLYEGYSVEGCAILIEALTDNKNRTFTNVRNIMNKNDGSLGEQGSVSFMFEKKGYFEIKTSSENKDDLLLDLMDTDPDSIEESNDSIILTCKANDFAKFRDILNEKNLIIDSAKLAYISNTKIEVSDEALEKISNLIDKLEEDDDVMDVYTNL